MPLSYLEVFELLVELHRSSPRRCSKTKVVLNIFAKFLGKHLSQSLLFNKVAGLRQAILLKERLWYRCFSYEHLFWRTSVNDSFWLQAWEPRRNWTAGICYFYLVYINIFVDSSFPSLYIFVSVLKLYLQTENYMENFGRS